MRTALAAALGLALLGGTASAEDTLKLAIGQRGNWDTSVSEIGQRAGIFKKHGIAIELLFTQGGAESQQAVISGDIDVAVSVGIAAVLGAAAKGAPVRVVSAETTGQPDIAKAKDALAKCGKPNGFNTVIAVRNKGKEPKVAEAVQQALSKVGINATIDSSDPSLYYRSIVGSPDNVHKKGYGIMVVGWGADFPTGFGFLDVLVDGDKILPSGNNNYPELNDPAIQDLIKQALASTDPAKAASLWGQINAKVMDTATLVPLVFDKALNYRNPRLTNVYVDQYYGMDDFQALGVSK